MAEPGAVPAWRRGLEGVAPLLSSNLLGAAVGGAFFLAAAFSLSLEEMGLYSAAISVQWIAVGLVGSGLSVATLRQAADRLLEGNLAGAAGAVVQSTLTALAATLAAVLVGAALVGLDLVPVSLPLLGWVLVWAGARSAIDTVRSGLLVREQYGRAGLLMVATAVTGVIALGVALREGLTLERLLAAHALGLASGGLLGALLLRPLFREGLALSRAGFRGLLRYARWPSLGEGARLLQVNAGPLLLLWTAGEAEAGVFGLARYPAFVFDVVAVSLYQFWLSQAVQRGPGEEMGRFLVSQLRLAAVVGSGAVLVAFLAAPWLGLLGDGFAKAAPLLGLNALDFALLLLLRPIESVYHGLHAPRLEVLQRAVVLPVLLLAGLALAPRWGAAGMVWAHVLAGVTSLVVGALLVRSRLAQRAAPSEGAA